MRLISNAWERRQSVFLGWGDFSQFTDQGRQVLCCYAPYDVKVHMEIIVYNFVTHTYNRRLRNIRM